MHIGKVNGSYEYEMKGVFGVLGDIHRLTILSQVGLHRGVMILIV